MSCRVEWAARVAGSLLTCPALPLPPPAAAARLLTGPPASLQCAAPAPTHRVLSTTPSDEFNRELSKFFGAAPPSQQQQGSAAAGLAPSAAAPGEAQLLADVSSVNAELFTFLGMPQQGAAEGGTAASLAQQLAALAGQATRAPAAAPAAAAPQTSTGGSSSNSSLSSHASSGPAASSGGADQGLTHVDASGKAAMVDVSEVGAWCSARIAACRGMEHASRLCQRELEQAALNWKPACCCHAPPVHAPRMLLGCHPLLLALCRRPERRRRPRCGRRRRGRGWCWGPRCLTWWRATR